ncbi:hypothetical protein GOBAR_AA16926 [Gossypium barbadense]|uniref:Uncharacterized protein n=1 Tax=Gossypium barbadense TaxID=3634 RepID=A0A2P5XK94_GOSBA|nr:hypothetical protein GOBAR_AA16926 [Gossypium barbadense]
MLASRFSFFGGGGSNKVGNSVEGDKKELKELNPTLKLQTDRDVYRPGDSVYVTIEICNPFTSGNTGAIGPSLLIEKLGFEIKGIEKLDTQWYATQKPAAGTKQRRDVVRAVLPSVIPPSYKGSTIRYIYYIKSALSVRWLIPENGHSSKDSVKDLTEVEARVPLQVWVTQKGNGLVMEDGQSDGIVPDTTIQTDIYWKEMDGDSEWVRLLESMTCMTVLRKDMRAQGMKYLLFHPLIFQRKIINRTFGSSLSLQSSAARSSFRDGPYYDGDRLSLSSNVGLPRLSVAEVLHDSSADVLHADVSTALLSPSQQQTSTKSLAANDITGVSSAPSPGATEPLASEGFIRGRSYNIRMDDQVLLRFSPKNSESTYYFSDMIGGTLTFFHEEGARRCLEVMQIITIEKLLNQTSEETMVSVTLETSETISRRFVHPSRRNSPTITKVQSDHHEVVADLVQTGFLFSVPMDGPMSFSTPHVSVQWVLRFEFFTTPKNVDWTRYEHPLFVEGRDKCEWVLPITVHAPPPGAPGAHTRSDKPFSLEPLWTHS